MLTYPLSCSRSFQIISLDSCIFTVLSRERVCSSLFSVHPVYLQRNLPDEAKDTREADAGQGSADAGVESYASPPRQKHMEPLKSFCLPNLVFAVNFEVIVAFAFSDFFIGPYCSPAATTALTFTFQAFRFNRPLASSISPSSSYSGEAHVRHVHTTLLLQF